MKKTILIIAAILSPLIGSAQEGKELYNKYAGKKGVQAVYISSTMFELMKSIPDMEVEGVHGRNVHTQRRRQDIGDGIGR